MAKHGHGTTFSWNGNTVGELTNIGTPQITADSIDVTTHQSADSYREFIPGLLNAGAVTLSGWFKASDADGQAAMLTDMASRTVREAIVTLPDNLATFTFNGFLTSWNLGEAGSDGAIPFAAEVKVTGKPTFAVATVTGMSLCVVSGAGTTISPTFAIGTKSYVVNVANEEGQRNLYLHFWGDDYAHLRHRVATLTSGSPSFGKFRSRRARSKRSSSPFRPRTKREGLPSTLCAPLNVVRGTGNRPHIKKEEKYDSVCDNRA